MATLALSLAGQFVGGAVGGPIGATIGRALGALTGSAVDSVLFGEKAAATARPDIRLQGSSEGGAIPRLYGWSRLAGNIVWATELEEITSESRGGKGTAPAADAEICASFAVAFCEGEVHRLGRVWADGQLLELEGLNARFYRGSEDQSVDSLIEAKQGDAPAYRGLCYLVFERLPLGEFGNRVPNITVELCRVVGELESLIRSVTVIPGATEFGYDPTPRVRVLGPGSAATENAHQSAVLSDWTLSIDELVALCPNLEHVSLVVSWFGDDLRASHCTMRPKVEAASRSVRGAEWNVAGISRGSAEVVSTHAGGPAYGGTPSDAAVRAAIADLKARGLAVTLYPMLLMDIPEGNAMGQPAYPWRGRITGAAGDVAGFVGSVSDWGLRRMVRHYAGLADEAGADALVIASELVGMTTVRGGGGFPFVDALVTLVAEAKAIAPGVALTYAADWSEYHGFQPADAPGDKLFHLDPLWASDDIAAVGIDNYMPVTDWRDGEAHADFALWDGPHALDYLTAGIAGGEGFDWFYASYADRLAGVRTPIADGAHGEDWVWRFKDIAGWWSHTHHDRVGGGRSALPTAWVPGSKPVWFTELGCGAVDKGANQPNVFPDGKSAEGGRPYFSSGAPDGLMQRQFLRAQLSYWAESPMVERVSVWTWDARPYPAFPSDGETWSDAANHAAGHWLTGRLGALASDEMAAAVAADWGTAVSGVAALPLVHGVTVEGVVSARDALDGMLGATGLSVRDGEAGLALASPSVRAAVAVDDVVAADGPMRSRRRPDPSEAVGRLALTYVDRERDYLAGTATAVLADGGAVAGQNAGLVLDAAGARVAAERALVAASASRDTLELTLPPSFAALEVGDVIVVAGEGEGPFEITEIRDGVARKVSARAVAPVQHPAVLSERVSRGSAAPAPAPVAAPRPASQPADAVREERVKMTRLRQTIARRLKDAQNTAAMLTTFNEVDMTQVMSLRNQYKDLFEKKHGVKLGFMGFFVRACVQALKDIPAVNAEIDGTDIVYKNFCHVGVAVGTEKGLVVPVVRDADQMGIAEVEKTIADFGRRARDGKLTIEEMQGGTFTISNGGVYGSLMSTPILNAPQSGILGMHKIQERPMVIGGKIEIRPMMYLALSYDHRIVDGKEAVTFLVRVKESLEDPARLVMDL